mmetsp:Transcript_13737/g.20928  ORF Transcript_13737/g.20928 Transcript_13737/m.20928 type:complete len:626 (-) Transcript_13737:58-1935(-)
MGKKNCKRKRAKAINATSQNSRGRSVIFREISLLNEINEQRTASGKLAKKVEAPRSEIAYIHPDIFFLGETKLNDALNWNPVRKKVPVLSQLLKSEEDREAKEIPLHRVRRDAIIDDFSTSNPAFFDVPIKRSNSVSSFLSNVSYRSILSTRLFGDDEDESLEYLSYLDVEKEEGLDDSGSTRYSYSDTLAPRHRSYRRGSILSTFGTIASNPIEEMSNSDCSEEMSLGEVFSECRENHLSRRNSVLSALSNYSSEAIREEIDGDNGQALDLDQNLGRSRSDSISIARSIVAGTIKELSCSNDLGLQQVPSTEKSTSFQEKSKMCQDSSTCQKKPDIEDLLIEDMHKSNISCLSIQLEDLVMEQHEKIGVQRRRNTARRRSSDFSRVSNNERWQKPSGHDEDSQDLNFDQSSRVSRSDSISRARSVVTETIEELSDSKEMDQPFIHVSRENPMRRQRHSMYQKKPDANHLLVQKLHRSNTSGASLQIEDLSQDQHDIHGIKRKKSALYRRMSMIGGGSDHGKPFHDDKSYSNVGSSSNYTQTNATFSSAIHRRMSMVPKRQSIHHESSSIVSSDHSATTPRSISPTPSYDIKHSAVSKWRSATQKFNQFYVDLQIQSSAWASSYD